MHDAPAERQCAEPVPGSAGGQVVEPGRFGNLEGCEDLLVAGGEPGALGDVALGGGQGDQVEPVELVADGTAESGRFQGNGKGL